MDLKGKLKNAMNTVGETAKSTGDTLKDFGGKVVDNTGKAASKVADKAGEAASIVADKAGSAASKVADKAGSAASKVADKAGEVVESTKERFKKEDNTESEQESSKVEKPKKINLDETLKQSIEDYNVRYTKLSNKGSLLYTERERSVDLLDNIENLINSIANKPKSFDADTELVKAEKAKFKEVCDFAKQELELAKKTSTGAAGGVSVATAVASLAPSAALWVASAFGTASTGTAISTLTGAAASKAALAWLGGGALSAGGGGVAAGNALLALAGPVGWTIAGASILTSVTIFATNKVRNNKKKNEEIEKVKINLELIAESTAKTKIILDETVMLRDNLSKQYTSCMPFFAKNFLDLDDENQKLLGTLVNNSKALSATLEKTI